MTSELRIRRERPGLRLVLDFEGPVELAAALAEVVARFEGAPGGEPPASERRGLTSTERSRKRRAERRAPLHATGNATDATADATASVAPPGGVASASLSGSLPSLSPALSPSLGEIESETRARVQRNATATATADATGRTVAPVDLDQPLAPWALPRFESLRMTLGPPRTPIDVAFEWSRFVPHIAKNPPRQVCEAEWQSWLTGSWTRARAEAERPAPLARGRIVQGGGLAHLPNCVPLSDTTEFPDRPTLDPSEFPDASRRKRS